MTGKKKAAALREIRLEPHKICQFFRLVFELRRRVRRIRKVAEKPRMHRSGARRKNRAF